MTTALYRYLTVQYALFCTCAGCSDAGAALTSHNTYRARHIDTPAMVLDSSLQASAQMWANTLASRGCKLEHSRSGENLAAKWSSAPLTSSCVRATDAWYNEISQYRYTSTPYTNNPNFGAVGHFTQVVWVGTIRLGCAGALGTGTNGYQYCTVEVCHYGPAGNYNGDSYWLANVKPLVGSAGGTATVTTSPPATGGCTDNLSWCASWASRGYCDPRYEYQGLSVRNVQCRRTCGACTEAGRRMLRSSPGEERAGKGAPEGVKEAAAQPGETEPVPDMFDVL